MNYTQGTQGRAVLIFVLAVIVAFFIVMALYINVIKPFMRKADYIKMEMERAYSNREYAFWKNELKKLYISSIPIFGKTLLRYMK